MYFSAHFNSFSLFIIRITHFFIYHQCSTVWCLDGSFHWQTIKICLSNENLFSVNFVLSTIFSFFTLFRCKKMFMSSKPEQNIQWKLIRIFIHKKNGRNRSFNVFNIMIWSNNSNNKKLTTQSAALKAAENRHDLRFSIEFNAIKESSRCTKHSSNICILATSCLDMCCINHVAHKTIYTPAPWIYLYVQRKRWGFFYMPDSQLDRIEILLNFYVVYRKTIDSKCKNTRSLFFSTPLCTTMHHQH